MFTSEVPIDKDAGKQSKEIREIQEAMENYRTTIHAALAFARLTVWDNQNSCLCPDTNFALARRMTTSPQNRISPGKDVHPDLVVQADRGLGLAVETKISLPEDKERWRPDVEQLEKYDDDLVGWWTDETERIANVAVILLIERRLGKKFSKYLSELKESEGIEFTHPFAIVEFNREDRVDHFIYLEGTPSQLPEGRIAKAIDEGLPIRVEDIVAMHPPGFCDDEPVTEYTMELLWQHIFNDRHTGVQYDEARKAWPINVNATELTKQLQLLYGSQGNSNGGDSRGSEFPKKKWVRKALDQFVSAELAKKGNGTDDYQVLYKRLGQDVIKKFIRGRPKKAAMRQLKLKFAVFEDPTEDKNSAPAANS